MAKPVGVASAALSTVPLPKKARLCVPVRCVVAWKAGAEVDGAAFTRPYSLAARKPSNLILLGRGREGVVAAFVPPALHAGRLFASKLTQITVRHPLRLEHTPHTPPHPL